MRTETERPETVTEGTDLVIGTDPKTIVVESLKILRGVTKSGQRPELWDGHTAYQIVQTL